MARDPARKRGDRGAAPRRAACPRRTERRSLRAALTGFAPVGVDRARVIFSSQLTDCRRVRTAVVGHVEWVEFGRVDHVPAPGEIVHLSESWEVPGGGGAVAAVQLCKLAPEATLYTALGDDEVGHRCQAELERLGLRVQAVFRPVAPAAWFRSRRPGR